MSDSGLETQIRTFLVDNFGYRGATAAMPADTMLLDQGIIDSTGVLEIVKFFEDELGLSVADEELVPDNFGSVARLVAYVTKKKG
ncbi:acyl carrier protein [Myxococcota bacterium]|nr:acyl carrier protein [Myxococcota bacterium]